MPDLVYREAEGYARELNMLDVYHDSSWTGAAGGAPVVAFVHGGNWRGGDKEAIPGAPGDGLASWFVRRRCVFASLNFRLLGSDESPGATLDEMADDIARAVKWLTVNGRKYGGRPGGIVLAGFSSGAHLAALVATDAELRARHRLGAGAIGEVIGMDVPFYDVPAAMAAIESEGGGPRLEAAREVFGHTRAEHLRWSPAARLDAGLDGVRFLLLSAGVHTGLRQDFSRRMSARFAQTLAAHGLEARHEHFPALDHLRFLQDFAEGPGEAVEKFLRAAGNQGSPQSQRITSQ